MVWACKYYFWGGEPYAILYKQVTNFGVIKFAVSKFTFELLWFGLVCVGGGRQYAITSNSSIIWNISIIKKSEITF
jgi:hypothetical protein